MIKLFDVTSGKVYGTIDEEQLRTLMKYLEEESLEDTDYYINRDTVDLFEERNADPALVELLRTALGDREDMDIRWVRE